MCIWSAVVHRSHISEMRTHTAGASFSESIYILSMMYIPRAPYKHCNLYSLGYANLIYLRKAEYGYRDVHAHTRVSLHGMHTCRCFKIGIRLWHDTMWCLDLCTHTGNNEDPCTYQVESNTFIWHYIRVNIDNLRPHPLINAVAMDSQAPSFIARLYILQIYMSHIHAFRILPHIAVCLLLWIFIYDTYISIHHAYTIVTYSHTCERIQLILEIFQKLGDLYATGHVYWSMVLCVCAHKYRRMSRLAQTLPVPPPP